MKYFIDNLTEEQWKKNRTEYWKKFDKLRKRLPDSFVEMFSSGNIHDSRIESIEIKSQKVQGSNKIDVVVKIINDIYKGDIIHHNVTKFSNDFNGPKKNQYLLEYLYGEVLREKDCWVHNFTHTGEGEVYIKCSKIEWVIK